MVDYGNRIVIQISLKFVPKGSIDNKSALVRIMAWRQSNNPLYEPMVDWFIEIEFQQPAPI